jgi:hypothetical protein
MKKIVTLAALSAACLPLLAQQRDMAPNYYFTGPSASLGVSSNKSTTTTSGADTKGASSSAVTKLSYGIGSASIFRLGLSLSADLKSATISDSTSMKRKTPTELTIEPGVLLTPVTLGYAKFGNYYGTYTTALGSQGVTGTAMGLGLKSYLTEQTFISGEFTQHKANGSPTLGWDKFKQTSTSVMLGYNF